MGFKVHEQNGNWALIRDGANAHAVGTPIDYEMFQDFKDDPSKAAKYFRRDDKGKLVLHKRPKRT